MASAVMAGGAKERPVSRRGNTPSVFDGKKVTLVIPLPSPFRCGSFLQWPAYNLSLPLPLANSMMRCSGGLERVPPRGLRQEEEDPRLAPLP